MANIYFGDNATSTTDHNWNTVGNWYTSLGVPGTSKSAPVPGALAGRLPNLTTDTVVLYDYVTTGPNSTSYPSTSGIYTRPIVFPSSYPYNGGTIYVSDGHYSGAVTLNVLGYNFFSTSNVIRGGTWDGAVTDNGASGISGGTFNGTFTTSSLVSGTATGPARTLLVTNFSGSTALNGVIVNYGMRVAAGSSVVISGVIKQPKSLPSTGWTNGVNSNGVYSGVINSTTFVGYFQGGTYQPKVTCTLSWSGNAPALTWTDANGNSYGGNCPAFDPGFALGGGTFSPQITYVGFPDIIGAGLL